MDGFVALLFIVAIVVLLVWANSKGSEVRSLRTSASPSHGGLPPAIVNELALKLRVTSQPVTRDGTTLNLLKFESRGLLAPRVSVSRPALQLTLVDATSNTKGLGRPVLTIIDDLQAADSIAFEWTINFPRPLQMGAGSLEWVNFGSVPIDALIFPEGGQRRIKAVLRVMDLATGSTAASAECTMIQSVGAGYLELEQEQGDAQAASLKLAMCLAAADGVVDDDEVHVIKSWGEKSVKALDAGSQTERQHLLNSALRDATQAIRAGDAEQLTDESIDVLNALDEPRYKYDAYELCLQVLRADGQAHPEEMASVTVMARRLGLDEDKVRWMTDRHTADVEFTVVSGDDGDDDQFLGITSDMDKEEIKKHLNRLFKKHSARATHDDPKVAERAREWLDRIGKARVRHLG